MVGGVGAVLNARVVAGSSSFVAWLPITAIGLLMSFSILVFVGVPTLVIGVAVLVASVRAARGGRAATVGIVGAAALVVTYLVAVLWVDHSAPGGVVGWLVWSTEAALASITVLAGCTSLAKR